MYAQIERERSKENEIYFPPQEIEVIETALFKGKKIYLAHSGNRMKEGKLLQKILENAGYKVINPFDNDDHSKALTERWNNHPELRGNALAKEIVKKDLLLVSNADVLVAQILEGSFGTPMEIFHASLNGIPVFILTEIEHPWLIVHGIIVKTVEQLLEELKYE